MPTVATVDGVKIVFYANEHPPPHFHAKFAEHQAVIDIERLEIIEGSLPAAKRKKVLSWAASRQAELRAAFVTATALKPIGPIK